MVKPTERDYVFGGPRWGALELFAEVSPIWSISRFRSLATWQPERWKRGSLWECPGVGGGDRPFWQRSSGSRTTVHAGSTRIRWTSFVLCSTASKDSSQTNRT